MIRLVQIASEQFGNLDPPSSVVHRILVVDDSAVQRKILSSVLTRQGYEVLQAENGVKAVELLQHDPVDLVLSDWMMPEMDGLELCRWVRSMPGEQYIYFILLTSKNEKGAVAEGLNVGADDFLSKPPNADELRARINAGDRILRMERELFDKNKLISSTLDEISALYDALDRDLLEARKLQQAMMAERYRDFGAAEVSIYMKPSSYVGGDLVGFFGINETKIGFYSIDVSGHGVASAVMTFRLAGLLRDSSPAHNVALVATEDGTFDAKPPAEVAEYLNRLMMDDIKPDLYFTLALGVLDLETGNVDVTQCGHPNPVVQRRDGHIEFVGQGGMPIGLLDGAEFQQWRIQLRPGDRFMFFSDGFTECENESGVMLEEHGFAEIIRKNASKNGTDFFDGLVWDLDLYAGGGEFGDDVSCAMVDFIGRKSG